MDKAIEQVFKVFNHLAREVQVYLFSGLVIATNALLIDHFYYNSSLLIFVKSNSLFIPSAIILYILGQFCMALYHLIFEWKKCDKKISKYLELDSDADSKILPKLYQQNAEVYFHFVERYVILSMMRWTISAACFINFIVDIFVLLIKEYHWQVLLAMLLFGLGSFAFYLLTLRTDKDYEGRINSLKGIYKLETNDTIPEK